MSSLNSTVDGALNGDFVGGRGDGVTRKQIKKKRSYKQVGS